MARILIVSDRIQAAQGLEDIVRGFGHDIVGVSTSASEAASAAAELQASIAFIDMMLEDGRGAEVAA
ncbi:MAG: response regulator, partial [Pseudomonadota bacterium]